MCGGNIFLDKSELSRDEVTSKLDCLMKSACRQKELVWFIQKINRKILAEEMLYDASTDSLPYDYKFFMFNGVESFIEVDIGRFKDHKRNMYDASWNRVDFVLRVKPGRDVKKPDNLNEMLSIARKLSEGFSFVRVDLYTIGNRIYFGELTFNPGDASLPFRPVSYDYILGEKWVLSCERSRAITESFPAKQKGERRANPF
jgi:TupA-like ATPgrasp